jgi:hypothetical protein
MTSELVGVRIALIHWQARILYDTSRIELDPGNRPGAGNPEGFVKDEDSIGAASGARCR